MQLLILYQVYQQRDILRSLMRLRSIAGRMFPHVRTIAVVVDNSIETTESKRQREDGYLLVGGDNRVHEFSAWDLGYRVACAQFDMAGDDLIMFANETFDSHADRGYLDSLDSDLLKRRDIAEASIGYCDDIPRDAWLLGLRHRWWFRSNIFIHRKATVDRLSPLTIGLSEQYLFDDDPEKFWSSTDIISENWKAYIKCWLFGHHDPRFPEYRLHWHRAERATQKNIAFFRKKALCILSEHYMGARLANWKIPIIDFNVRARKAERHLGNYLYQFLSPGAFTAEASLTL